MTLPTSPTIKIPLNTRDPNQNTSTFRRLLESNRTVRCRVNVKKRPQSDSKQKQKSSQKPCLPSSLKQVEQTQSSDTPSPSPAFADVCGHFKLLEQRKKRGKETPSHTKPKQKSKEPKLQLALNRDYNNYRGREIFIETDTPIFTLPTESMWNIFERCSSVEDYYQISCVCKKWRSLINSAPLWRDMTIQWRHLLSVMTTQSTLPYCNYITTLSVSGSGGGRGGARRARVDPTVIQTSNMSLLHLRHIRIANINFTDVKFIMEWIKHLESVHCEGIFCTNGQNVSLRIFTDMPCLKSLKLDFAQEYHLSPIHSHFDMTGSSSSKKPSLPNTIETFCLQGVYDREEHTVDSNDRMIGLDRQDRWHMLEEQLVLKYRMLTLLTRLKSLTLGRISSFTSRVWLDCLKPCGSQLEYLTLKNWPGAGKRESPQILINRRTRPAADESERIIDGIEAAIAEYFSSLNKIKEICLDDFVCDIGLIDGISKLDKTHRVQIEGLEDQRQYTVSEFKAVKVFGFKISMHNDEGVGSRQLNDTVP
ncbi:hypothetical protein HMPREF1544_00457 [Mucor circinelloides 1006PhL]|uniref:F-box domain-containing protein n=1 Tax=Mucor circinelloides f. circinelloides (strain 1006PhL) TaxID=1220926 RepID=S2KB83_MUCC1|nr:hypothetical protein HMPREF1544_00457 [Mucor circinelloides 1006PhL]